MLRARLYLLFLVPFTLLRSLRAGVPIVPFTINGSGAINPRNRLELRPGTISVSFALPVAAAGLSEGELMERVRESIAVRLEVQ